MVLCKCSMLALIMINLKKVINPDVLIFFLFHIYHNCLHQLLPLKSSEKGKIKQIIT